MDWIVWLVVIIVVVAVVWWLLNRNKNRPGTDSTPAGAAGTGNASGVPDSSTTAPAAGTGAAGSRAVGGAAVTGAAMAAPGATPTPEAAEPPASASAAGMPVTEPAAGMPATEQAAGTSATAAPESSLAADNSEWETQWSETAAPTDTHTAGTHHDPTHGAHVAGATAEPPATAEAAIPAHHPEYTEPHAPTLPGAESAAAERADDEEANAGELSGAGEPTGHLATEQPYGEGSAAPAADGSGPEGFTVKGEASSMVYHDETSPAYEQTRAEVWFISAAHAEAAGFRPPRRTRL